MLPGKKQRLRIERTNRVADFRQLQQTRTRGNEQADTELDGRYICDEIFLKDHAEKIPEIFQRTPRSKRDKCRMQRHPQFAKARYHREKILTRVTLVEN